MNPFASSYENHTTVHPVGALALAILGVMLLVVKRNNATLPLLIMACFIPSAQRIVIVGLDFDFLRIMVLLGSIRVLSRGEWVAFRWISLDTLLVIWTLVNAVLPMVRFGVGELIVNRLGAAFDILGMYFLCRILIRSWEDVRTSVRWIIFISWPVAASFAFEWATGKNPFSVFGGVPPVTAIRDGRLRCQGAFAHPILAGAFWAAAIPLVVCQFWQPGVRKWQIALAGCASVFIVVASASSTPVFGVLIALIGLFLYPVRSHLRVIRWSFLFLLIGLHLIMQAPVWHLIARVSSVGGGSGWHRFFLIDGFINHFDEWWAVGSYVGSAHWGHFTFDVTNIYIVQGLNGGLLQLGLWLGLIALAFAYVGRLRVTAEVTSKSELTFVWGIGVSLLVHTVNHFGVTYFGQIWLGWYMLLGMIGSLYAGALGRLHANFPLERAEGSMLSKGHLS